MAAAFIETHAVQRRRCMLDLLQLGILQYSIKFCRRDPHILRGMLER